MEPYHSAKLFTYGFLTEKQMSYSDKRFCVYFYKDKHTMEILYVGNGTGERPYAISSKHPSIKELKENDRLDIIIAFDCLSKDEAVSIENEYLDNYLGKNEYGFNLLNKAKSSSVKIITYAEFSELFYYDESSPTFLRWKVDRYGTGCAKIIRKGDVAGVASKVSHKKAKSYSNVGLNYKTYMCHRIIYSVYHKVDIPVGMVIDHIDGVHSNNHISNLRLVSQKENMLNVKIKKMAANNITGVTGVSLTVTADGRYWRSAIGSKRTNTLRQKYFNIKTHGTDEAFRLACEWRKQMEELHYNK